MPAIHRTADTAAHVARTLGSGPVSVAAVLRLGVTKGQLRAAVGAGALRRVRHGFVQVVDQLPAHEGRDPALLDRARTTAVLASMGEGAHVSHATAGALWGLPSPRPALPDSDIWVLSPRHGVVHRGVHLRVGELADEDSASMDGIRCTSLARTALDMARFRPLPESLVVLDAALRRLPRNGLWEALDRHPMTYGRRRLEQAIREADARSESPLESASRGLMIVARLARPQLQRTLWVEGRAYRLDFLWDDEKVAGEADGWGKLQTIEDLRAEKQREDGLRRRGLQVVRWSSDDVWRRPDTMVARLAAALRQR